MKIGWLCYDTDYPDEPPTLHAEKEEWRGGRWVQIVYAEVVQ